MIGERFLLAVILGLGVWSAAAAEGAWVVWKRTVSADSEEWSIHDSYLNKSRCQGFGITSALTLDVRRARSLPEHQAFEPGEDGRSYTFSKTKPDGSGTERVRVRFICLPDTIDPRDKNR